MLLVDAHRRASQNELGNLALEERLGGCVTGQERLSGACRASPYDDRDGGMEKF